MSELLGNSEELELTKIRLERTVDAAYHALLEMSAWMGIPESKRQAHIQEHMSNVIFCAKNNLPDDPVVYQNAIKSNVVKNDSGVDHWKDERVWWLEMNPSHIGPYNSSRKKYDCYNFDQSQFNKEVPFIPVVPKEELDRVKALLDEAVPLLETAHKNMYFEGSEVYEKRIEDLLQKLKGGV